MFIASYIELLYRSETNLRDAFIQVSDEHKDEPDIEHTCRQLSSWSDIHVKELEPFKEKYSEKNENEPDNLHKALFHGTRKGGLGLLRDLHDLFLMANEVEISYTVIKQAALALRDGELENLCERSHMETLRQTNWIKTRIKQAAPQSLVAA